MLIKTEEPGYMKDATTGAIINTNDDHYKRILAIRAEKKKGQDLCKRMNSLENDLREIKELLVQVLGGRNNG